MKKRMSFYDVQRMNDGCAVLERETEFEVYDKKLGIVFAIPLETDVLFDGSMFNPIRWLAVPTSLMNLVLADGLDSPVFAQCLCGIAEITEESGVTIVNFVPGITLSEVKQTNAILLRAHWDVRDGISDFGWNESIEAQYEPIYTKVVTDDYHMAGDWYWVLRPNKICLPLTTLSAHYYSVLGKLLAEARKAMEGFELNKAHYASEIEEVIKPLKELGRWGVFFADSDVTTARKYETTDVKSFRHDAIGLNACTQEFRWIREGEVPIRLLEDEDSTLRESD